MDLTIKTVPSATSITLEMAKAQKRVRHGSEDDLINLYLKAADAYIEKRANIAVMEQTLVLRLSRVLPVIYLPRPPIGTITHVKYTPRGGAQVIPGSDDYVETTDRMLRRIEISALGGYCQDGAMEVEYKAGAANADAVPAPLRQAALMLVAHWMSNREATFIDPRIMNVNKKVAFGVDELIKEYRVPNGTSLNDGW